ncbi:protein tiptop isoform X1 [Zootermopsis nevadensis]|uniref:protein tiptop isoform X1 n=1 Tax=Zootermopsis nevadensis TaxID=136037 RepID=UPI000B8E8B95|nr:protein tiptop isoform X1 [Zootermopsis nevadensis]
MPRRKQDCPKRMKWEGGEGGEEGGPPDSPGSKLAGDDASSEPVSPTSATAADSPGGLQEDVVDGTGSVNSPVPTAPASPATSSPMVVDGHETEPEVAITMLQDPLAVRETPGSRCPSRESRGSSVPPRCPSRESLSAAVTAPVTTTTAPSASVSPVAVTLPPTAALLPPHSAAIAAYLGVAAAAQHSHHRLLMTSPVLPRGSVSPLVSSSSSPPILPLPSNIVMSPPPPPLRSPMETDSAVLDFSTKKLQGGGKTIPARDEGDSDSALNLIKPTTPVLPSESHLNGPLDLSVPSRKRGIEDSSSASLSVSSLSPSPHATSRKNTRLSSDFKASVVSPWTSPVVASHFPYFAAAVAASMSPKNNSTNMNHGSGENPIWNGKMKMHEKQGSHYGGVPTPSDATKALEKMSELSKLGGDDMFRPSVNSAVPGSGGSTSGRHSAWQSHWLNKGADQAKDVLKCVWCKQSFPSLAAMTAHMKEAKHCGVNVPAPSIQPPPPPPPQHPPTSTASISTNSGGASIGPPTTTSNKPTTADLNLLIKETMPLPRKLVRGQDVWLGKGAEQTRQILKCMWCGQSFRSLAEMTSHMQQTQHYTNIISQEQIISWKSSDDSKTGGGPGSGAAAGGVGGASSHVSAVLTCKVCDQAFSSLKELSNHMVKNSHYKEHIMRSITESGGRRRQTREKRKKSLPVRKLLELERAQHELKNGEGGMIIGGKVVRDSAPAAGRITCEKCGEKIETSIFVEHIRQCVGGGSIGSNQRNLLKNALLSSNVLPSDVPVIMGQHIADRESRKSISEEAPPPAGRQHRSPSLATDLSSGSKEAGTGGTIAGGDTSSPSVLNAIEKLIEKSFDSRTRHSGTGYGGGPGGVGSAPMGSSILKRLGIDESVDYTKPLVDAQTMNILRSYHHHHHNQQHHYSRRERSGSESSSVSDRGGGGGRTEALTPDRKSDLTTAERLMSSTPRTTPEKGIQTPPSAKIICHDESVNEDLIKKEAVVEEGREDCRKIGRREVIVKKEEIEDGDEDDDDKGSFHSNSRQRRVPTEDVPLTPASGGEEGEEGADRRSTNSVSSPVLSPRQATPLTPSGAETAVAVPNSPCRNSTSSPASSDRSGTPRSTAGTDKKPSAASGTSLGALSSMFDSLSGGPGGGDSVPSAGRSTSSHPLAALQKLCDKTERHGGSGSRSCASASAGVSNNHSSSSGSAPTQSSGGGGGGGGTAPGAILAFSWACNDAVMTGDSVMKCAFCDTPFISKGAYRHHLSKMHFVKDGVIPDPVALKAQQQQQPGGSSSGSSSSASKAAMGVGSNSSVSAGANSVGSASGSSSGKSPQEQANFEESPHSKFLKYTELAKQLSSKYV